jgi:hypothetical protein
MLIIHEKYEGSFIKQNILWIITPIKKGTIPNKTNIARESPSVVPLPTKPYIPPIDRIIRAINPTIRSFPVFDFILYKN